jgi:hypothetical protein
VQVVHRAQLGSSSAAAAAAMLYFWAARVGRDSGSSSWLHMCLLWLFDRTSGTLAAHPRPSAGGLSWLQT